MVYGSRPYGDTMVARLMSRYGIDMPSVALRAGCHRLEVGLALHPWTFRRCPVVLLARVRAAVEDELRARGWPGGVLWQDFDPA